MTYYRVRLPDNSPESQIGCFCLFENARLMADANPGYCVFVDGEKVYPAYHRFLYIARCKFKKEGGKPSQLRIIPFST